MQKSLGIEAKEESILWFKIKFIVKDQVIHGLITYIIPDQQIRATFLRYATKTQGA